MNEIAPIISFVIAGLALLYTIYREVRRGEAGSASQVTRIETQLSTISDMTKEIKTELQSVKQDLKESNSAIVGLQYDMKTVWARFETVFMRIDDLREESKRYRAFIEGAADSDDE